MAGGSDAAGAANAAPAACLEPRTRSLALPDVSGPLIVKIIGTDAGGRRVAAWAEIPPEPLDGDDPAG